MNVRQEDQQARKLGSAGDKAKLRGRLDGIDGVSAGIRQSNDLRL